MYGPRILSIRIWNTHTCGIVRHKTQSWPHGCKCPVTAPTLTAPMSSDGDKLTVSMCNDNESPPCSSTLRFKASWKLPLFITASTKGDKFVPCKRCCSNFGVAHGGFNDMCRALPIFKD